MTTYTRPADPGDRTAIRRLATVCFDREPIQRAAIADLLLDRPQDRPVVSLVADLDGRTVGFAAGSVHERVGYVDALAVEPATRRRGVGARLLADVEAALTDAGADRLGIGGSTWYYGWPGVDVAYTAALSLFERAGYSRSSSIQNMEVDLDRWIPGTADGALHRHGGTVMIKRAALDDWPQLEAFVTERFTETWRHEAGLAVHRDRPTVFFATRGDRVVGFACHAIYRHDWFGPVATDPDERGTGIGEALLRLCLDDMAASGIAVAQIGWIGPMNFYSRTVDARCGRVFAVLERTHT